MRDTDDRKSDDNTCGLLAIDSYSRCLFVDYLGYLLRRTCFLAPDTSELRTQRYTIFSGLTAVHPIRIISAADTSLLLDSYGSAGDAAVSTSTTVSVLAAVYIHCDCLLSVLHPLFLCRTSGG
jgi:hypothetical protein